MVKLADMAGPRLVALGLQATAVEEHGLYPALLQLTKDRNLTASHLTMGLVGEMASLVFVRQKGGKSRLVAVPKDQLAVKEFGHVVVFVAARLGVEVVTASLQRSIWAPKVLQKQVEEMGEGELWPGLARIPGIVMERVQEERNVMLQQGEVEVQEEVLGVSVEETGYEIVETEGAEINEEGEVVVKKSINLNVPIIITPGFKINS